MSEYNFDLVVIGSGPAGQKAAIQASKLGKRVAIIERAAVVGGECITAGTIPSKGLREAIVWLTKFQKDLLLKTDINRDLTVSEILGSSMEVVRHEIAVVQNQLHRNHIRVFHGTARFLDPHTVAVRNGDSEENYTAGVVVIASGSVPARPNSIPFDDNAITDSASILKITEIPPSLIIVGGGVIGVEYASFFAALGSEVTIVDKRTHILEMLDAEVSEALSYHMRQCGMTLRLGEEVASINRNGSHRVVVELASGKKLHAHTLLYATGRLGATAELNLEAAGLSSDDRGRISVSDHFQTAVPHVYAVGDVIGFPALAATSMEQGRVAACHAFGVEDCTTQEFLPIGIYTIPEIAMVGATEEELTKKQIPYEVGRAQYREIARGKLMQDEIGFLKLLVHPETRKILGVHGIGEKMTELVHVGQAVMALGGTVDYFVSAVFNYPTLAECYKTAALDVLNKLRETAACGPCHPVS